jgi:hypothetical protein
VDAHPPISIGGMMKQYIELIVALIMVISLGGVLFERIKYRKSIGIRTIQFMAIAFIFPVIIILALEGVLSAETIGTLIGTVIGYVLSGIGGNEARQG